MVNSVVVGQLINSSIQKMHINIILIYFQLKHLLNLTNEFVRFKDTYGKNSANKMLPRIPETWRHVVALRNPTQMSFLSIVFQKR